MAVIVLQEDTTPSTPAAGRVTIYSDSADSNRMKFVDESGTVRLLETEWSAVPTHILFASDNTYDIGDATHAVRTIYVDTSIVLGASASKIVPGSTSFAIRNNADNANNLIITDAGAATVRTSLTVTTALSVGTTASITGDLTVDTNVLKVDSSNNWVGIGTATPQAKLHVVETNSNFAQVRLSNTANSAGEKNWEFITRDDGRLEVRSLNDAWNSVNSTPLAMEASTGYVGMGTTSPAGKLHIADTDGGALFWRGSGIDNSTGSGNILTGIVEGVTIQYVGIAGTTMQFGGTVFVPINGAEYSSGNHAVFQVSAGGVLTVYAGGGSNIKLALWIVYR